MFLLFFFSPLQLSIVDRTILPNVSGCKWSISTDSFPNYKLTTTALLMVFVRRKVTLHLQNKRGSSCNLSKNDCKLAGQKNRTLILLIYVIEFIIYLLNAVRRRIDSHKGNGRLESVHNFL